VIGFKIHYCLKKLGSRTFYYEKRAEEDGRCSLLFILAGKAGFSFKNTRIIAGRNDVLCWDHGDLQEAHLVAGAAFSFYEVIFEMAFTSFEKTSLKAIGFPYLIKVGKPRPVLSLIENIYRTYQTRSRYHLLKCSTLGLSLLRALEEGKIAPGRARTPEAEVMDKRIRQSLAYLARNYKRALDVPTLARGASMHRSYFSRLFRKATGMSPYRYVLEYKIRKAQDFFLDYNYSPERQFIASELGFHDFSHFYRTFKAVTGLTPAQFVAKYRAG